MPLTRIHNVRLVRGTDLEQGEVWIRDGKFVDPQAVFFGEKVFPDRVIDGHQKILAPGYIDVQLNGAFGIDFSTISDDPHDGVLTVAKKLVTQSTSSYHHIVPRLKPQAVAGGATVLGLHLEGPFINLDKSGAHDRYLIRRAERGFDTYLEVYSGLENVCLMTVAPEVPGVLETITPLTRRGIVVSAGHSEATFDQGVTAMDHGITMLTHLFNAMQPFHHRDPGLVGLLGRTGERPFYGLISDGIHVHSSSIRIAFAAHPRGVILVSDAMAALGLPSGRYALGSIWHNNFSRLGGVLGCLCPDLLEGDRVHDTGGRLLSLTAVNAATLHPAQLLGLGNKGRLEPGCDADLVLLDDDLWETWVAGEKVWSMDRP